MAPLFSCADRHDELWPVGTGRPVVRDVRFGVENIASKGKELVEFYKSMDGGAPDLNARPTFHNIQGSTGHAATCSKEAKIGTLEDRGVHVILPNESGVDTLKTCKKN